MTTIPQNEVTQQDLEDWYKLQEDLSRIRNQEMLLRKKIFDYYFPAPKEGTNTYPLPDGYALKGGYVINRTVDVALLTNFNEKLKDAGVSVDKLVKYEPKLAVSEYRTLTEEQRQLFDQVLIIKPGSPSLEIVLPKKRGTAS